MPKANFEQHRRFIFNSSLILMVLASIGLFYRIYQIIIGAAEPLWLTIVTFLAIVSLGGICWLVKRGQVDLAAKLFLGTLVAIVSSYFIGSIVTAIIALLYLIVIIVTLILFNSRLAYFLFGWNAALLVFKAINSELIILDNRRQLTFVVVIFYLLVELVIIWLISYLANNLRQSNLKLSQQAEQLQQARDELEQKRLVGETVSQEVFSLSSQLNTITDNQAGGSREQATALTQVTGSIQELTATAQAIAAKAGQLNQAVSEINQISERIKDSSVRIMETGENGAVAVEESIKSTVEVNQQYAELRKVLTGLEQHQSQIKAVTSNIKDVSDQTHLLALNAAIEAAGAGENGERFAVVAAEVRNLATRSIQASREISDTVGKLQEGIAQVVHAVERGQHNAESSLQVAQQSGKVLRELVVNILQNAEEVQLIEQAGKIINSQAFEINLATQQQVTASQQVLESLQVVGAVAGENAQSTAEVTKSMHYLEELSQRLLLTLAR